MSDFLATSIDGFGGILRCESCGEWKPLDHPGRYLQSGWPAHCGYTMRWWTQRQLDAGEMPILDFRP